MDKWKLSEATGDIVNSFMENFIKKDLTPFERRAYLIGAGRNLYKAAPKNFKSIFWKLIDNKKDLK